MRNILLYATLAFVSASVISGILASQLISLAGLNPIKLVEARWLLIAISPAILAINFVWLRSTPAKGKIDTSLQALGQTALFLWPYYWIINHA